MDLCKISIYELYVDKFSGTFQRLIDKIPYLADLGITHLWILPHFPSPMVDDGYDVSDYFNVRSDLGTIADFEKLVSELSKRDMFVMIDWVINHTSTQHPWFIEAASSIDNSKRDYYLWSDNLNKFSQGINAFPQLKSSNWIYNAQTQDYYYSTFYPEQADLNWENEEVYIEMQKFLDFWINLGVQGFRIDAVSHMIKSEESNCRNQAKVHSIMKEFRKYVSSKNKEIILLGEASGKIEEILKYFGQGDELHFLFNFYLTQKFYYHLVTNTLGAFKRLYDQYNQLPENCCWANVLRNHDELNFKELPKEERQIVLNYIDPDYQYGFIQGESVSQRLATAMRKDEQKIRQAWDEYLQLPGVPIIYYGEEIAMVNENPSHRYKDTRRYLRSPMDWEKAEKQINDHNSLYNYIASKLKERKF